MNPLKVICLSDLHIGKESWKDYGKNKLNRVIERTKNEHFDVFLFNGDLAEPNLSDHGIYHKHFFEGLKLINEINVKDKLFVLGNNDIELFAYSGNLIHDVQSILSDYSIHLLDVEPFSHENFTFIGGHLGWNGDLWRPSSFEPIDYPKTKEECDKRATREYRSVNTVMSDTHTTNRNYFNFNVNLFKRQLEQNILPVIMCTHTVPTDKFVVYGHSEKFDYLNYFMGYDINNVFSKDLLRKVRCHISGHTHRTGMHVHELGFPMINVSSNLLDQVISRSMLEIHY